MNTNYTYNSDYSYYEKHICITNCGSFAFNLKEWYDPDSPLEDIYGDIDTWVVEQSEDGLTDYDITEQYLNDITDQVLKDFEGEIALCDGKPPSTNNKELIALCVYCSAEGNYGEGDHDFHFKVFRNGKWLQKNGADEIEQCNLEDWGIYTSDIVFFYHTINQKGESNEIS